MLKETDMNGVRKIARLFMRMEPESTAFSPMIIRHPFTDCGFVHIEQTGHDMPDIINIMENKQAFSDWQEQ